MKIPGIFHSNPFFPTRDRILDGLPGTTGFRTAIEFDSPRAGTGLLQTGSAGFFLPDSGGTALTVWIDDEGDYRGEEHERLVPPGGLLLISKVQTPLLSEVLSWLESTESFSTVVNS